MPRRPPIASVSPVSPAERRAPPALSASPIPETPPARDAAAAAARTTLAVPPPPRPFAGGTAPHRPARGFAHQFFQFRARWARHRTSRERADPEREPLLSPLSDAIIQSVERKRDQIERWTRRLAAVTRRPEDRVRSGVRGLLFSPSAEAKVLRQLVAASPLVDLPSTPIGALPEHVRAPVVALARVAQSGPAEAVVPALTRAFKACAEGGKTIEQILPLFESILQAAGASHVHAALTLAEAIMPGGAPVLGDVAYAWVNARAALTILERDLPLPAVPTRAEPK